MANLRDDIETLDAWAQAQRNAAAAALEAEARRPIDGPTHNGREMAQLRRRCDRLQAQLDAVTVDRNQWRETARAFQEQVAELREARQAPAPFKPRLRMVKGDGA